MRINLCLLIFIYVVPNLCADARLVLVAGGGSATTENCPATEAKLAAPFAIQFNPAGDLFFAEYAGHRIRKIDSKGMLTTVAGTGDKGFAVEIGPAIKAQFNAPHSLSIASNGDLYVSDTYNNRIRKIDAKSGGISTFAGSGDKGFAGDGGQAGKAVFGNLYCTAFDPKFEHLYVVDLDNRRVRVIDMQTSIVSTVAGNGQKGVPADGAEARTSPLLDPRAVAADAAGNIYILERSGHALRVVDAAGKIRTVAGTGKAGPAEGETDAPKATLNGPKHIAVDADNNVLIADSDNNMIRKYIVKQNKIVPVAGTGVKGVEGLDGSPLKAQLNKPHWVWPGDGGTIYIADSENNRILKIEP